MSDDLRLRRPASRRSPREAAHRQRQHRIFERLRKRSKRGRGTENRLWGFSTASLGFLRLRYYNQESKCQKRLSDVTAISRIVVIALAVFFDCYSPHEASSVELPRLSGMVNDFSSSLQVAYVKDLEVRLRRFNEKTGYAIIVVVIPSGEDEQISNFIAQIFVNNGLEQWGLGGTVLVLITIQEGW